MLTSDKVAVDQDPHGRDASSPLAVPAKGWKEVLQRAWREAGDDNVGIVAAGVAFYGFLALVPLLGAIVLSYGLIAEPATVLRNMKNLTSVMPADAAKLIGEQLMNVVNTSGSKKGLGLVLALALALFGARNGAGSIITALNIAYEEKEARNFVRLNLLALAMTLAAVLVAVIAMIAITALGHLETLFPNAPGFLLVAGKVLSYLLVVLGGAAGAATLYRYGPSRDEARWVWLTPGSIGASVLWLTLTLGFGFYVAKFGNYNATYGSLGTVVVMLTWLYLSSYVLLLGAEVNSELEQQTERDTTVGPEQALGTRRAKAADTVADGTAKNPDRDVPGISGAVGPEHRPEVRVSVPRDYATSRRAQHAGPLAGLEKVGAVPSVLATSGLAMLRGRKRVPEGIALLGLAAAMAWFAGAKEVHTEPDR
jgi:membrane protein